MDFVINLFSHIIGNLLIDKLLAGLKPILKGREIQCAQWFFVLSGIISVLVAIALYILSMSGGGKVGEMWICIGPFLLVGIVLLVIGIIRGKSK